MWRRGVQSRWGSRAGCWICTDGWLSGAASSPPATASVAGGSALSLPRGLACGGGSALGAGNALRPDAACAAGARLGAAGPGAADGGGSCAGAAPRVPLGPSSAGGRRSWTAGVASASLCTAMVAGVGPAAVVLRSWAEPPSVAAGPAGWRCAGLPSVAGSTQGPRSPLVGGWAPSFSALTALAVQGAGEGSTADTPCGAGWRWPPHWWATAALMPPVAKVSVAAAARMFCSA